jgi:hypothetical protein
MRTVKAEIPAELVVAAGLDADNLSAAGRMVRYIEARAPVRQWSNHE